MSALVSSFVPVDVGRRKYLFFLVSWTDFVNPITEALIKNRDAFGEALGLHATLVRAYSGATQRVYAEVKVKAWPPEIDKRLGNEQYPFLLILEDDFAAFEPSLHRWGIVWLSDMEQEPDKLWKVFAALARKVHSDADLFDYLRELSRNAKYAQAARYVEAKPGVFGVTVNLKAIAEDLLR